MKSFLEVVCGCLLFTFSVFLKLLANVQYGWYHLGNSHIGHLWKFGKTKLMSGYVEVALMIEELKKGQISHGTATGR